MFLGIGQPELQPHVSGRVFGRGNPGHFRFSFSAIKSFSRLRIRSMSAFGVATPFFDFFWKA